jgi:hypothetical protein
VNPKEMYEERLQFCEGELQRLKRTTRYLQWGRISAFVLIVLAIWQYASSDLNWLVAVILLLMLTFAFLIRIHAKRLQETAEFKARIQVIHRELNMLRFDYRSYPNGVEYADPDHAYASDLDLFGDASLFQYLSRANTSSGGERLAAVLKEGIGLDDLTNRQESVRELASMTAWREDFMTAGYLSGVGEEDRKNFMQWIRKPFKAYTGVFFTTMLKVLPLVSFVCLFLLLIGRMELTWFILYMLLPIAVAGAGARELNAEANDISDEKENLMKYRDLLRNIERGEYQSDELNELKSKLIGPFGTAGQNFVELVSIVTALDNRINGVGWLFLNVFLLWDVRYGIKIRKWKEENHKFIENWFEVVAEYELINSLATLRHNRPELNFPRPSDAVLKAEGMGHLLLDPRERIDNDFRVDQERFYILTGANMAGKSTFLRAIGTNLVLANMGAPVSASSFEWKPLPIYSSMRTKDSLDAHESYFFAELKRLQALVQQAQEGELFIILDEILKGTNSEDKAKGSALFVEKLLAMNVHGIIATHDLSLCALSSDHSGVVKNISFEVEFVEDDLKFDYRLREGICQNMNASFLLKKMGLTPD